MGFLRRKSFQRKETERFQEANDCIIEFEINAWFEKFHKRKPEYIG